MSLANMHVAIFIIVAVLLGLWGWRAYDARAESRLWQRLEARAGSTARFDESMVAGLPLPAKRLLRFMILPETDLSTVATIRMHGEMGLGTRDQPNYMPMRARQLLAPPFGFVWHVEAGRGLMRFSGSDAMGDSLSWSRFWLLRTLPLVRAGGDLDHLRAAFGRVVGESVFWTPAALLPRPGVNWSAIDDQTARVSIEHEGLVQSVDVTVAGDGRPTMIVLPRWSNANAEKRFRVQPFGGYLHDFRAFGGFRVPTRIEAGNLIGTDDYFPFFKAIVDDIRYLR